MTKLEIVHCKDCGFWSPIKGEHNKGWGICVKGSSDLGEPNFRDSLAVAQDYEEFQAELETKPEFGCVMGQVKEESHDKT